MSSLLPLPFHSDSFDSFQFLIHFVQLGLEVSSQLWSFAFECRSQKIILDGEHFVAQENVLHLNYSNKLTK